MKDAKLLDKEFWEERDRKVLNEIVNPVPGKCRCPHCLMGYVDAKWTAEHPLVRGKGRNGEEDHA